MVLPTKIQHPMLRGSGTSQRERAEAANLLQANFASIDGRKLGEMLDFIHEYARLVVFHEYKVDPEGQGYTELTNWLNFFKQSLPFIINQFSKTDFKQLEIDWLDIVSTSKEEQSPASLQLLLDISYQDLIKPLIRLEQAVISADFKPMVNLIHQRIRTSLIAPLRRFIRLNNVSAKYFRTTRLDFSALTQEPWAFPIEDLFATDERIVKVPGGRKGAIRWLGTNLEESVQYFFAAQQSIAKQIPSFLGRSIELLKQRNNPHLGLLYAFFRMFEHFQGELNGLTQQHLEFFYTRVLQLKHRDMKPDQVHLTFEPAKYIENYRVTEGTLFQDAKDDNGADILFSLDEEIIIDNAKVTALKTLFLNPSLDHSNGGEDANPVEGVYIAPQANSLDGKGKTFKGEQSKHWSTLGNKFSRYQTTDENDPVLHELGRLGFIFASPVLWLNEGDREVKLSIDLEASQNMEQLFGELEEKDCIELTSDCIREVENQIEALFTKQAQALLLAKFSKASPLQFSNKIEWDTFLDSSEQIFDEDDKGYLGELATSPKEHERVLTKEAFKNVEDSFEYELNLMFVNKPESLPTDGKSQVYVSIRPTNDFIVRIFDFKGNSTDYDRSSSVWNEKLTQMIKDKLNGSSELNNQDFINRVISKLNHTRSFSENAKIFLQLKFTNASELIFFENEDPGWDDFLQIEHVFKPEEKDRLNKLVVSNDDDVHFLKEF